MKCERANTNQLAVVEVTMALFLTSMTSTGEVAGRVK